MSERPLSRYLTRKPDGGDHWHSWDTATAFRNSEAAQTLALETWHTLVPVPDVACTVCGETRDFTMTVYIKDRPTPGPYVPPEPLYFDDLVLP